MKKLLLKPHLLISNFLLGLLLVLAFAPINLWPLGILVPAALLFLWQQKQKNFYQGFAFGLGFFGLGASWVFISINTYGNTNIFIACAVTLLFIFVLALIPACQAYSYQRFFKTHPYLDVLLIFPSLWVVFELLRGSLFTGFPWLLLGYTQTFTWLSGIAKVFGVYGVSWLCAFLGAVIYLLCKKEVKRKAKIILTAITFALLLLTLGLKFYQFTKPIGPTITVALVQGNIPENEKWDYKQVNKILLTYSKLTGPNLDTSLIVWPENAITLPPQYVMNFLDTLDQDTKTFESAVIIGLPIENPATHQIYNGALALGDADGMYLKRHLVPFGEYTPLQNLFGSVLQFLNISMSDFSAGPMQQLPMFVHGLPVSVFICYEIAYPEEVRSHLNHAVYVLNLTDDSWFGHSWAASQQNEIAAMRAIEIGRPVLTATNTGITSIIDAQGKITATAPEFQATVLKGRIQPMQGQTPWLSFGYVLLICMLICTILGTVIYFVLKRK